MMAGMTEPGAPDILLAEDSATMAELLRLALQHNGSTMSMQVVLNGNEVVERLLGGSPAAFPAPPRLLILDLHLPALDGLQVLERLRADERTRLLPVVVVSASRDDALRRKVLQRGANEYLEKPAGFAATCAMMAELERRWVTVGETP